jgi:uncharacterized membrane protein (DUF4010 family)
MSRESFATCGVGYYARAVATQGLNLLETREARLALSLVLGLLLGVERERRKRQQGHETTAGLRTFGLVGFLGGLASYIDVPYAVVAGALVVGALTVAGYALDPDRARDKGLTTEVALLLTYVLGALALSRPDVAGVAAIIATSLLAFRTRLHHFVQDALREEEVHDGLLLLVFAFIALPLAPDIDIGPYRAINPQALARLMLLVTLLGSAGYVAQRMFGARSGMVASGFAGGFVSSSATIAALGLRAKQDASNARAAAAGGVASSIATILQYAAIITTIDPALLKHLALPLGLALLAAVGMTFVLTRTTASSGESSDAPAGRAFQVLPALVVGAGSAVLAVLSAGLSDHIGSAGIVLVSSAAGFVDAHATTGSIATLHRSLRVDDGAAMLALIAALSTNTLTKIGMAALSGSRVYAGRLTLGVLAIAAMAWLGVLMA